VYQAKTTPTGLSVTRYIAGIADRERRSDCKALLSLMKRATGCTPRMWGTSIVGFDSYHYKYDSGHEGDSCIIGFSSRKGDITLYLVAGYESAAARKLLSRLGKHRVGKACLYLKRLSDIDLPILEQLIVSAVAATRRRYPQTHK
jgi:hypothetical protein